MISLQDVIEQLNQLEADPSILHWGFDASNKAHLFVKEWLCNQSTAQKQAEYGYVWSLVYGWEVNQMGRQFLTSAKSEKNYQDIREQMQSQTIEMKPKDKDYFRYCRQNQAFIRFENNLFWINPTYESYQRNKATIQSDSLNFIITLTTSNLKTLINFLKIQSKCPQLRLITIQHIYLKLKKLISFIVSLLGDSEQLKLNRYPTNFLTAQEYFQYANLIWLTRQNCWYQPSFDLVITFMHSKQSFLIEQPKLSESKLVYYGWKKNIITQENYQRYIRQWDKSIVRQGVNTSAASYSIPALESPSKQQKHHWYLDFIQKQLFATLCDKDLEELFSCCELIEVIPNQVICKLGYLFDFLYIILEGQFQYSQRTSEGSPAIADRRRLFGLEDLRRREATHGYSLKSMSKGTILRIDKNNLYFHLYDVLQ